MAVFALTDPDIYVAQADLTPWTSKVEVATEREQLDVTTFNSAGWKESIAGLSTSSIDIEGFWEAGGAAFPDDRFWADLGNVTPMSVAAANTVASICYFTNVMRPSYQFGDAVGQVTPFQSSALGTGTPLIRGQVAQVKANVTATSTTTAVALPAAVTATQRIYAVLHIFAVSGTASPTLTATVQTDNAVGFPSPASAATFTAATAVGSQLVAGSVGGATGETHVRLSYTVSGTTPSFSVFAAIGVA